MIDLAELAPQSMDRAASLGLLLLAVAGCSDPSGPKSAGGAKPIVTAVTATGTLAVRVVRNVEFDPNGFSLSLDGAAPTFIPAVFPGYEQAVPVSRLAAGVHKLIVGGLAGNCVVSPQSPIEFAVSPGITAQVSVAIVCVSHE